MRETIAWEMLSVFSFKGNLGIAEEMILLAACDGLSVRETIAWAIFAREGLGARSVAASVVYEAAGVSKISKEIF